MPSFPLFFHGAGLQMRLLLRRGQLCLEGSLCPNWYPLATTLTLEVFFQPRCRDRLPQGLPVLLCREELPLEKFADQPSWQWTLPAQITPQQAVDCHYRITPADCGE